MLNVRVKDNMTLTAEESSDPAYPGIWITARVVNKDGREVEVAAALIEYDDNKIKGRLWNYESLDNDPIVSHDLYSGEEEEE